MSEAKELTEEEKKEQAHFLGKNAVVVKAPSDNYLENEEALKRKPRGKVVKGDNNLFI